MDSSRTAAFNDMFRLGRIFPSTHAGISTPSRLKFCSASV